METILDTLSLEEASQAFAALGSEQRLSVLQVLVSAGPEGLPTGVLGERCSIAASTLTHHLRFLATAGLVTQKRAGRTIYCTANFATVERVSQYLLLNCCADAKTDTAHAAHQSEAGHG